MVKVIRLITALCMIFKKKHSPEVFGIQSASIPSDQISERIILLCDSTCDNFGTLPWNFLHRSFMLINFWDSFESQIKTETERPVISLAYAGQTIDDAIKGHCPVNGGIRPIPYLSSKSSNGCWFQHPSPDIEEKLDMISEDDTIIVSLGGNDLIADNFEHGRCRHISLLKSFLTGFGQNFVSLKSSQEKYIDLVQKVSQKAKKVIVLTGFEISKNWKDFGPMITACLDPNSERSLRLWEEFERFVIPKFATMPKVVIFDMKEALNKYKLENPEVTHYHTDGLHFKPAIMKTALKMMKL